MSAPNTDNRFAWGAVFVRVETDVDVFFTEMEVKRLELSGNGLFYVSAIQIDVEASFFAG
ncbi:hypothetical protein [Natronococcus wangiae]|uniref:hypothetical protein n=1 Tax=Natronococcus wangiae TaxID=3068275 RepID=UPI00273E099E|nr:hypothetical protein [Natronococcus sp. AD5]